MPGMGVICFSHLRWDFVFQRPNHLMTRFAREGLVLFVEEPIVGEDASRLELVQIAKNLWQLAPQVPEGVSDEESQRLARDKVRTAARLIGLVRPVHWFYTPMMLPLAEGLPRVLTVYDCMDELSNFAFAPNALRERERELMSRAELMFTGGQSLHEAKRPHHANVHAVPSSVDAEFFAQARAASTRPSELAALEGPIIGYCGVIDERMDLALLDHIACERPDFQFVLIGPVVKIDPSALPRRPNLHYIGARPYQELPSYLGAWDVAILPFALNEATRFISPTKTPEYLAAGLPVVSTAISDVVEPYERLGLVRIGRGPASFLAELDRAVAGGSVDVVARDTFLAQLSWDSTWQRMAELVKRELGEVSARAAANAQAARV